jgi:hypothetical protein
MKKRIEKKLSLSRETLRRLELQRVAGGLETTPIGTCPESSPEACGGSGGGSDTPLPCRDY